MSKGQNFTCETCGKEFYRYPSRIKRAEATGHKIRFCSQKCYDRGGENNRFWNGGSPDYWRKTLIDSKASCESCGYKEEPGILQIHHRDRDRTNNARENIAVLCPNCHSLDHFRAGDGIYTVGYFKHLYSLK